MKNVALIGNPNVGKSTIFNTLTGLKQHTGNWSGKTITHTNGIFYNEHIPLQLIDLPGTYSLNARSFEEKITRDYVLYESYDATIIVCDATCLKRNLFLVLQILECAKPMILCVNLMDEAKKKNIEIDISLLEKELGIPVIATVAKQKHSLNAIPKLLENLYKSSRTWEYDEVIEVAIDSIQQVLIQENTVPFSRALAIQLLCHDLDSLQLNLKHFTSIQTIKDDLCYDAHYLQSYFAKILNQLANQICDKVTTFHNPQYMKKDLQIDRLLTHRFFGYLIMIFLLSIVFYITIIGANVPSSLLFEMFSDWEQHLLHAADMLKLPEWFSGLFILGGFRVLAWVVSVMLPPMAIFFPLFTLLEDLGYLPRIAFNLDSTLKKCHACGKQALTMCMGFGCNAVGVIGARIIDSPRERYIAMLTNNFVPCNGRFPTIIMLISLFLVGEHVLFTTSLQATLLLSCIVLFGIFTTFVVSYLLSKTYLKGEPSSITLELPPYRKPQVLSVISRSIYDRTLFVLGRAIIVAFPAGLIIWILANVNIADISLIQHLAQFLNPLGQFIGLDGVILLAFILGFPANEIVVPIMIMIYMNQGVLINFDSLSDIKNLLLTHDWTSLTALNMILFSLLHWPCSTTCLTIKKETGSIKWTLIAFILPTLIAFGVCFIVSQVYSFL